MARAISLLFILCASLFLLISSTALVLGNKPNGFTVRLIHRDSPDSPLYPGNLTRAQTIDLLVRRTKARAYYLSTFRSSKSISNATISPQQFRPKAEFEVHGLLGSFLVEVGIGNISTRTPKYIPYFLSFDTGDDLIWTQCEDCAKLQGHKCFNQTQPIFPNSQSSTFKPILSGHNPVTFRKVYGQGLLASGIMGHETFTFASSSGSREAANDITFGCGNDQKGFDVMGRTRMAGVMGASWGANSLISQLRARGLSGNFSYCMPQFGEAGQAPPATFLRFGDDIPRKPGMSRTSLVQYPGEGYYYVNLIDLSLDSKRIRIPSDVFAHRAAGTSGTIIDSGGDISLLNNAAFNALKIALTNHFLEKGYDYHVIEGQHNLELCYSRPASAGYLQLPTLTFVFSDGSGLQVPARNVFILDEDGRTKYFCLAMHRSPDQSCLIGAFQQRNQRIIYDTTKGKLHFGTELCHISK